MRGLVDGDVDDDGVEDEVDRGVDEEGPGKADESGAKFHGNFPEQNVASSFLGVDSLWVTSGDAKFQEFCRKGWIPPRCVRSHGSVSSERCIISQ